MGIQLKAVVVLTSDTGVENRRTLDFGYDSGHADFPEEGIIFEVWRRLAGILSRPGHFYVSARIEGVYRQIFPK